MCATHIARDLYDQAHGFLDKFKALLEDPSRRLAGTARHVTTHGAIIPRSFPFRLRVSHIYPHSPSG